MEVDNLCTYLAIYGINLTSNNKWLSECISWFKSNSNLMVTYGSLQNYVSSQWLLTDLKDIRNSCLPSAIDDRATLLPGKYAVQINWMKDIGQSCYSQYRSIQSKDAALNEDVTAEESKKQSWEPNPKRVLMMEITDGVKTMKAMEYGAIPKLGPGFLPGMKILLKGPIECRRKILFLKNSNVDIFGGEVDSMYEDNRLENLLARSLNLPPLRPTPTSAQDNSAQNHNTNTSTRPSSSNLQNNFSIPSGPDLRHQTNSAIPNTEVLVNGPVSSNAHFRAPASSNVKNSHRSEFQAMQSNGNREMDISEDDDDIFNQLPDYLLKDKVCANSYESIAQRLSPVLGGGSNVSSKPPSPQSGPSSAFQVPSSDSNSSSRSLQINRHKRFPSVEDFNSEEKADSVSNRLAKKQSTLSNFVLQKTPAQLSSARGIGNSSKYFIPVPSTSKSSPIVISDSTSTDSPFDSPKSPMVNNFIPTSSSTCLKKMEKKLGPEIKVPRQPWDDSHSVVESNYTSNLSSRSDSDYKQVNGYTLEEDEQKGDDDVVEIVDTPERTYPLVRKQHCSKVRKVKSKVKGHKWFSEAEADIDGKSTPVHFSSKVLVEVFPVDTDRMVALREEFKKTGSRSAEQQMFQVVTLGNKRLESLNCRVTVEYSSDDCTPLITSIDSNG